MSEKFEKFEDEVARCVDLLKIENQQLFEIYIKAIIKKDPISLVGKSKRQLNDLKKNYKHKNKKEFQKFADSLFVVRSDDSHDIFKAPIHTWNQTGGWWSIHDFLVKAQNYVYASFDQIPNYMTSYYSFINPQEASGFWAKIRYIDENEIRSKSEIAFCDIASLDLATSGLKRRHSLLESYLNNLFDYNTGKELLVEYLSIVFNDTQEMKAVMDQFRAPQFLQNWNQYMMFENFTKIMDIPWIPENLRAQRMEDIHAKMIEIYEQTWILPPFWAEIRIHDEAKSVNREELLRAINKTKSRFLEILTLIYPFSKK
ncbi:MAG: hypothetical protein ACD_3C00086G0012 [uncultured bacterium (gcode 4)]|uniref:Uncharacterized protein n=1 Tax=uncultured bacterium (gcode 4) TaxID=1234023 RepID=K2FZ20_9BACT|nr:MAG: hypothetical protein ACD_3C00086G0012 [uncultured bacterium (gcode 4)]